MYSLSGSVPASAPREASRPTLEDQSEPPVLVVILTIPPLAPPYSAEKPPVCTEISCKAAWELPFKRFPPPYTSLTGTPST